MTEIKLNQTVTDLLSTANSLYPGNISVRFGDTKAGYVRHDQAQQVLDDGDLTVRLAILRLLITQRHMNYYIYYCYYKAFHRLPLI
ncbi:hypothetical protein ACEY16_01755 [Lactiplantibacillus plantarum]